MPCILCNHRERDAGSSLVGVTQIVEVALKCKEQVGLALTIP